MLIPLGRRSKSHDGRCAVIDECDRDLADVSWHLSSGYVRRWEPDHSRKYALHRVIVARMLGRPMVAGEVVDHINGNPLDNRRCNLRAVTPTQNAQNRRLQRNNTSGYRGVSFDKSRGVWQAMACHNGRQVSCGRHPTKELAAEAAMRTRSDLGYACGVEENAHV